MMAKMKNGATPSHCVGSLRLRASAGGAVFRETAGSEARGRSCAGYRLGGKPGGLASRPVDFNAYWTLAPTTASQFLVMASLALPCSSSVGNTAVA